MLGKRFRRTTSMSQLGAGVPAAIGTAGEAVPYAVVQGASNPHTVPYKAARPLILEQHMSAGVGNANHARRSDVNSAVPVELLAGVVPTALQTQRSCAMEDGWCAVDVICEDMCMEGAGSGSKNDIGQLVPSSFGNSSYPGAIANGSGNNGAVAAGHGSTMPYQMGIWLNSGMHAGQGNAKRELISPAGFLDMCFYCKRRLRQERDIFMYRGDTAFCSEECRHRQILIDERRAARTSSSNKRGGGGGARARSETAVAA